MSAPTATRALPLLLLLAGCNLTLGIEDKRYQRGHCEDTTGKLRPIPECSQEISGNETSLEGLGFTVVNSNRITKTSFDLNESGAVEILPNAPPTMNTPGAFLREAPFAHVSVTGNFAAMVYLRAYGMNTVTGVPPGDLTSSAIKVSDPAAPDRWWLWALGSYAGDLMTQLVPGSTSMPIPNVGQNYGQQKVFGACMLMCRVDEALFVAQRVTHGATGMAVTSEDSWTTYAPDVRVRAPTLQVGISSQVQGQDDANNFRSRFYWFRLAEGIRTKDDCLSAFGSAAPACER
jgi:hypothetical protein